MSGGGTHCDMFGAASISCRTRSPEEQKAGAAGSLWTRDRYVRDHEFELYGRHSASTLCLLTWFTLP